MTTGTNENGDSRPIAIQALDAGWDVWLGNKRGTRFSSKHDRLKINDPRYWNFDWSEMGVYDVPTNINKVLSVATDYSKVNYIGYSQGTSQMFYSLSHKSDFLKEKLNMFSALAPCSRMKYSNDIMLRVG